RINNVSHFIVVPVFYNVMLEEIGADLKHIKMICCAGDNFPDELIRKHFERLPQVRIFNEYGPTENSVNTTAYQLEPGSPKALIGKPISNVAVYVLAKDFSLCPIGVTGELCLAGSSLAVGYLNRPELTSEKFIIKSFVGSRGGFSKEPLAAGGIFYKSGDQGRWLPDGNLEFIGRVDNQVKIRGIRVETGEIENQLMKHDHIKEAAVQVRKEKNGTDYLCAYLVGQPALEPGGLKDYLSLRLPGYMIPSHFQVLEQLPLTPNGKRDVKALPAPRPELSETQTTPRDETEKKLVEIWKSVLG
ncbi:MAG: amino acid adenylation domain-containing protein, partial [bacterium]|nr:amino acid adenylation domain-containing protein [bacterium]